MMRLLLALAALLPATAWAQLIPLGLTGDAPPATASALSSETARAQTAEGLLAPLASPALTGTPTVPTAAAGTSTTQAASTAFATGAVATEAARARAAESTLLPRTGDASAATILPTGGASARTLAVRAADVANVLDFSADPTGVTDSTAAINAAIATGKTVWLPAGTYAVSNLIQIPNGQTLRGDDRTVSILAVSSATMNLSAIGVVQLCQGTGHGDCNATLRDIGISFSQPDQGVRANIVQFPPAIYAQASPRFVIKDVRVSAANVCLDARGNTGGAYVDNFECGALTTGMEFGSVGNGGAADFVHIDGYHFWEFGLSNTTYLGPNVFADGTTVAASIGEIDGLDAKGFASYRGMVNFTSDAQNGWYNIVNLQMDLAQLNVAGAHWLQISDMYSSPAHTAPAINVSAGRVFVNNYEFLGGSNTFNSTLGVSGTGTLTVNGGTLVVYPLTSGSTVSVSSGGTLEMDGMTVLPQGGTPWSAPVVATTGTGILRANYNNFPASATGVAISIATDSVANSVSGNNFGGMTFTAPGPLGSYQTALASVASVTAETTRAQAAEALLAPRTSPTFTGTVNTGPLVLTDTCASCTGSLTVSATSDTSGANIELIGNGSTTPNKWIRSVNGQFQVVNNAYSSSIMTLSDAGALSTTAAMTSPLLVALSDSASVPSLSVGGGTNVTDYMAFAGSRAMFGYDPTVNGSTGGYVAVQGAAGKGYEVYVGATSGFLSGTLAMQISMYGNTTFGGAVTAPSLALTGSVAQSSVLAGPSGAAGAPTQRVLGVADVTGAAPLASPALTGTPTAPTPAAGDNSTKLATTAFVAGGPANYSATVTQTYTSSGSWTPPANAKLLRFIANGQGGCGGGGGSLTSPYTGAGGGAGGGGDTKDTGWFPASLVSGSATITIATQCTVAAGGTAGGNGSAGGAGGSTTIAMTGVQTLVAYGGGGGAGAVGGTGAAATGGGAGGDLHAAGASSSSAVGGAGVVGAGSGGNGAGGADAIYGSGAGSGGGGTSTAGVASSGGRAAFNAGGGAGGGGCSAGTPVVGGGTYIALSGSTTSGGTAGGTTGGAGNTGPVAFGSVGGSGGTGGGGGTLTGGAGGNGGAGGGGGGGGGAGCGSGAAGGAGGVGGAGQAVVMAQ